MSLIFAKIQSGPGIFLSNASAHQEQRTIIKYSEVKQYFSKSWNDTYKYIIYVGKSLNRTQILGL